MQKSMAVGGGPFLLVDADSNDVTTSQSFEKWKDSKDGQRNLVAYRDGKIYAWVPPIGNGKFGIKIMSTQSGGPSDLLEIGMNVDVWRARLGAVRQIMLSRTGDHIALVCDSHVYVAKMPVQGAGLAKIRDIKRLGNDEDEDDFMMPKVLGVQWHSLCRYQTTLLVLTSDNALRLYDFRDSQLLRSGDVTVPLAQQVFRLPHKGFLDTETGTVGAVAFDLPSTGNLWSRLTAYILMGESTVCTLCPILPKESLVPEDTWQQITKDINERDDKVGQAWLDSFNVSLADPDTNRPLLIVTKRGKESASNLYNRGVLVRPYPRILRMKDSRAIHIGLYTPCAIAALVDEPLVLAIASAYGDIAVGWLPDYITCLWETSETYRSIKDRNDIIHAVKFDLQYKDGSMTEQLKEEGIMFCPADFDVKDLADGDEAMRYPIMSLIADPLHPDRFYASHCLGISMVTVSFLPVLMAALSGDDLPDGILELDDPQDTLVYGSLPRHNSPCNPTMGVCPILDYAIGYNLLILATNGSQSQIMALPLTHTQLSTPDYELMGDLDRPANDAFLAIQQLLKPSLVQGGSSREGNPSEGIKRIQTFMELKRKDLMNMTQGVDRLAAWEERQDYITRENSLGDKARNQLSLCSEAKMLIDTLVEKQLKLLEEIGLRQSKCNVLQERCERHYKAKMASMEPLSDEEKAYLRELVGMKKQLQQMTMDQLQDIQTQTFNLQDSLLSLKQHNRSPVGADDKRVLSIAAQLDTLNINVENLVQTFSDLKQKVENSSGKYNWDTKHDLNMAIQGK